MKILVVEDQERHLRDAIDDLKNIEDVEIKTATTSEEALKILETEKIDGVITDIFIPETNGELPIEPYGFMVAAIALGKNIHSIFCTDKYHHGEELEEINSAFIKIRTSINYMWGEKIIDTPYNSEQTVRKSWAWALERLQKRIAGLPEQSDECIDYHKHL